MMKEILPVPNHRFIKQLDWLKGHQISSLYMDNYLTNRDFRRRDISELAAIIHLHCVHGSNQVYEQGLGRYVDFVDDEQYVLFLMTVA